MTLLQPTDVPSRDGINAAITSEIAEHTDPNDPAGPHYRGAWTTVTKVSPAASMANITLQYRVTGFMVEWRVAGNTAAAVTAGISGDHTNQNITTGSIPATLRPAFGNWHFIISLGVAAHILITPGGTVTWSATEGYGADAARSVASGTGFNGQSPAYVLP
jgi:hypothetical protein